MALRIGLSGLALYIVLQQIEAEQLPSILFRVSPLWLLVGLALYVLSKVISSIRLNRYFRAKGIKLTERQNLRLYWIGMFYNLFLPGGVGGDAYKIWLLQNKNLASTGLALKCVLFDRANGLVVLGSLALIFSFDLFPETSWRFALLALSILSVALLSRAHDWVENFGQNVANVTIILSLLVQIVQVGCAWTLLMSLGITDNTGAYVTVFLISSAVAVLPISLGGVGIRELVFVTASNYSPISAESAVAFSMLFFLVTAASSLPGGFITAPSADPRSN